MPVENSNGTPTDPDQTIHSQVYVEFTIAIESNPSTGYSWQSDYNEKILDLIDSSFISSSPGVGAGGVEVFRFLPKKVGKQKIKMSYKREWEEKPIKELVYDIEIV